MFDNDNIQRFLFDETNVRGEIIHLDKVLLQVFNKHDYPEVIKQILTETLLCSILMSSTLKFKGQLTVQFQSDKSISLLLVKCTNLFQVRALAKCTKDLKDQEYLTSLENGSLIITIESDHNVKPYQSIVPLKGGVKQSIEHYFMQSEQLPTKFMLCSNQTRASGIMLQQMPQQSEITTSTQITWQHLITLAESITEKEILNLDNESILHRLFHEEKCRLFDTHQIQFKCPCSKAKMLETIRTIGKDETMSLLKTNKAINIECDFCLENYAFEKIDIAYLFQKQ